LTSFGDDEAVLGTILAGADGFLLKEVSGDELIRAVRTVASGRSILDPNITQRVLAKVKSVSSGEGKQESLAPQERRVLALVAEGKTNKEIAVALDLSEKTVGNYLSNIFQKLHVTRRSQAAVYFSKRFPAS
jgi:DNA-binding NarL/FixJ family response regulator